MSIGIKKAKIRTRQKRDSSRHCERESFLAVERNGRRQRSLLFTMRRVAGWSAECHQVLHEQREKDNPRFLFDYIAAKQNLFACSKNTKDVEYQPPYYHIASIHLNLSPIWRRPQHCLAANGEEMLGLGDRGRLSHTGSCHQRPPTDPSMLCSPPAPGGGKSPAHSMLGRVVPARRAQ